MPAGSCRTSRRCSTTRRRSEEHTSELQSPCNLVCRLLLEKKKKSGLTRPPPPRFVAQTDHLARAGAPQVHERICAGKGPVTAVPNMDCMEGRHVGLPALQR